MTRPTLARIAIVLAAACAALALAACGEKSEPVTSSGGPGDSVDLELDFYVNPDHAGIYIVAHLLPDLRTSGALVRDRVVRIAKLIDEERARRLGREFRGIVLVILGVAAVHIRAHDAHVGTERAHMRNLLLRHLVGNDQDAAVTFRSGDQGET